MTSGKDNRASSTEDGEIYPTTGDNGGGASGSDGFNLSSENQEIEEMRRRLRQMEEQEILPAVTAAVSHEDPAAEATAFDKSEVDARSIYVGNVDYTCLPEEVQQHFEDCGTVNRVTILTDNFGYPKGYAYVEFLEVEAVQNALLLNDTELHERRLKVCPKRTNVPGMNHPRGRRPYDPYYPPYPTYGRVPRFRRPPRYWPY
ncbi:polyadenylate-binding protein 1-like [Lolium perenne]|uniref:polyadenylate-binding protein 1-like n=1 Tax=Lolium perenne TaxID=4522 RepID=UPI0021F65D73|nr:polyadenylate-binding protein 1-like isoform X4 [Lolium perenne]